MDEKMSRPSRREWRGSSRRREPSPRASAADNCTTTLDRCYPNFPAESFARRNPPELDKEKTARPDAFAWSQNKALAGRSGQRNRQTPRSQPPKLHSEASPRPPRLDPLAEIP